MTDWTRRDFLRESLRGGAAVGLGASFAGASFAAGAPAAGAGPEIQRRVTLGRTGIVVPDIGFGSFSLESDERLVDYAFERGITHFDTAESYTHGRSEEVLGRALQGKRDRVTLTSKFWAEPSDSAQHQMQVLEESLRRLRTDYVDIYLNHAVNDVARLQSDEWQSFVARAKAQGKIRAIGMSGHSSRLTECLDYALENRLVDVILVAYNFSQQPSFREKAMRYLKDAVASFDLITAQPELPEVIARAHAQDVGVMVMKTLKGARRNDMRRYEAPGRTFAQSAFRWVLSDPNVDGLVVTMTSPEMVDEYVEASGAGPPDGEDLALLSRYEQLGAGRSCQIGCGDCAPACPVQVPIPDVMRMRMYDRDYGLPAVAAAEYARLAPNASACLGCDGTPCATACPHGIPIPEWSRETHRRLG